MGAETALTQADAGGLHGPPLLGRAPAINGLLELDWDGITRSIFSEFFEMAFLLLAIMAAWALFWLDPREPAYFWLGLTCAVILADAAIVVASLYTTFIPGSLVDFLLDALLIPVLLALWVLFWAYWFRLDQTARLHRIVWFLAVLLALGSAMLRAPLYGRLVPVHAAVWLSPVMEAIKMLLGALLVWVTVSGIRRNRTEGWLALPAVVLVAIAMYQLELAQLHVPRLFFPFGFAISLGQISTVLSLFIIIVLLLRRFLHTQREREQWKLEIEQARQVQQVIIPADLPQVPGLSIESEYRPAREVGGDFFQIIPQPADGSVLIVAGDVTGKGLQAGMLAALIVGAIRTATDTSFEPVHVLQVLNKRLCGRGQANATCLALRIETGGAAMLANAGHLPPYLNGNELPMPGALPLGMLEQADLSILRFQLEPGDSLTLLSDGVAEAQDEEGHLFGFDRIQTLLRSSPTAAEIAAAAQKFGQQDDITVIMVERIGAAVPAAA